MAQPTTLYKLTKEFYPFQDSERKLTASMYTAAGIGIIMTVVAVAVAIICACVPDLNVNMPDVFFTDTRIAFVVGFAGMGLAGFAIGGVLWWLAHKQDIPEKLNGWRSEIEKIQAIYDPKFNEKALWILKSRSQSENVEDLEDEGFCNLFVFAFMHCFDLETGQIVRRSDLIEDLKRHLECNRLVNTMRDNVDHRFIALFN